MLCQIENSRQAKRYQGVDRFNEILMEWKDDIEISVKKCFWKLSGSFWSRVIVTLFIVMWMRENRHRHRCLHAYKDEKVKTTSAVTKWTSSASHGYSYCYFWPIKRTIQFDGIICLSWSNKSFARNFARPFFSPVINWGLTKLCEVCQELQKPFHIFI